MIEATADAKTQAPSLADLIIAKTLAADAPPTAPAPGHEPILDTDEPVKRLPLPELLSTITKAQGKPLTHLVTEMARLSFAPTRISPEEYLDLRLYDDAGLAGANKKEFVGMKGCKEIALAANQNPNWFAMATEKLPFYAVMGAYGLPTIRQKAVYHPRVRLPGLNSIPNKDELAAWLRNPANYPCFGKPVNGSLSLGTVAIDAYEPDTDKLVLKSGRKVDVWPLVEEIRAHYRGEGYMFQERLLPHPEMAALTGDRIGTIRVYTIWTDNGPEVHRVCWKVPAGANMADNFWRKGNMLAALDEATGEVKRVIRGTGPSQQEIETHPDTGARLVGAKSSVEGHSRPVDLGRPCTERNPAHRLGHRHDRSRRGAGRGEQHPRLPAGADGRAARRQRCADEELPDAHEHGLQGRRRLKCDGRQVGPAAWPERGVRFAQAGMSLSSS